MTRLCAALFAVSVAATPVAAQVGHAPDQSPYRDLPWKQSLTLFGGSLQTGSDPADVGPQSSWLAGVRYDLRIGGPVSLVGRLASGPTSRRVINPAAAPASRFLGEKSSQLMTADLGIAMNLTGQKSWRRLVPVVSGGVGVATDFKGTPDDGGYRFGTRFMFTYGLGVRYHTEGRWEPRLDLTSFLWQLQYPPAYRATPAGGTDPVVSSRKAPWIGNRLWSLGLSYHLFR
ncbi:MAG: outer membrane beta-barrel protein [Gemmatimonadetes bacterium]|nr:outer membrane beta-barrel protein [Gemmatimonadota bacterium]